MSAPFEHHESDRRVIPEGLIVFVGPPGAGKSVFAKELLRLGTVDTESIISSDSIGEELFGREYDSSHDPEIFADRDRRIRERLARRQVAIADSTNVTPEARERLLRLAREARVPATALRFPSSLETILTQDRGRDKQVVDIPHYHELMETTASAAALWAEGFDEVFDVPGADEQTSPEVAARQFVIKQSV